MINNNFIKKNAQASLEYMSIFGIEFVLIALVGGLFFTYTNSAKDNLNNQQINNIGKEIVDNAEKIYFFGDGNKVTIQPNFPKGIEDLTIHHINQSGNNYYYLNISVILQGEVRDLIFQTNEDYIQLNCQNCLKTNIEPGYNISQLNNSYFGQGFKNIKIEAINNSVYIDFVE